MFDAVMQNDLERYDRAVDSAIATCGGDIRGALKALIIANEFLEEELRQAQCAAEDNAVPRRNVA
ncbi:MAG: hypothetical protein K2X60_08325 [Xanthobacteraceae bacterium]|nr:hypothetical protein [Xanthobacteraceae bacterium]